MEYKANYVKFERELFGKSVEIEVYDAEEFLAKEIIDNAYKEALKLQKIFNFYDDKSELSKLNKERKIKASKELLYLIKKALTYSKITKGLYDITLGKNIIKRKNGEKTDVLSCSYKDVIINKNVITLKNKDALIDLGSIAKGYIADRMAKSLKNQGLSSFILDARGDIIVYGKYEYVLGIKHPRNKGDIFKVKVKNKSIATSGDYNQYHKDYKNNHILNSKAISVSVISNDLTTADVLATALFVSEDNLIKNIAKTNPESKILIINENLTSKMFNKFKEVLA